MQLILDQIEVVSLLADIVWWIDWVSDLEHGCWWIKQAKVVHNITLVFGKFSVLIDAEMLSGVLLSENKQEVSKRLAQVHVVIQGSDWRELEVEVPQRQVFQ